jgi:hypothetical protein
MLCSTFKKFVVFYVCKDTKFIIVIFVFLACKERLRLYAVRDCGLLSCPPTAELKRGRMLDLPLKPLLHIALLLAFH